MWLTNWFRRRLGLRPRLAAKTCAKNWQCESDVIVRATLRHLLGCRDSLRLAINAIWTVYWDCVLIYLRHRGTQLLRSAKWKARDSWHHTLTHEEHSKMSNWAYMWVRAKSRVNELHLDFNRDGAHRSFSKAKPRHTGFVMDTAKSFFIVLQLCDICKEASLVNTKD